MVDHHHEGRPRLPPRPPQQPPQPPARRRASIASNVGLGVGSRRAASRPLDAAAFVSEVHHSLEERVTAADASLCYCVHTAIDSAEEMTVLHDFRDLAGGAGPAGGLGSDLLSINQPPPAPPSSPAAVICNSPGAAPILMVTKPASRGQVRGDVVGGTPNQQNNNRNPKKKKRKKAERSRSMTCSSAPPPPSTKSVCPPPPKEPPPLVVQVHPPTPTSPPATTFYEDRRRCSSAGGPTTRRHNLPLLTLPVIHLPGEGDDDDDDEDYNGDTSDASDERPKCQTAPITIASDNGEDIILPAVTVSTCEIKIEYDSGPDDGGGGGGAMSDGGGDKPQQKERKPRGRKRRRSLVNLLFNKSSGQEATTPTIEAPQGQRLHFRRVSEIFSRSSNKPSSDGGDASPLHDPVGPAAAGFVKSEKTSPVQTPVESCGLSIRNLFPYRRRRSSVHHMDNTEQFKESREEVMQNQRRRMSSFPPMDGDEAAIMLEKANVIRLEKVHQEALAMQSGSAVSNAFKRLRRGSRSPSPRSLLPGMLSKKSKWKSSTDVAAAGIESPPVMPKHSKPPPPAFDAVPPSAAGAGAPPAAVCKDSSDSSFRLPGFPNVPDVQPDSLPSICSPPVDTGATGGNSYESSTSVISSSGKAPAATSGGVSVGEKAPSTPSKSFEEPHRPHFVFPKRKLEDVPGIFIPKKSSSSSSSSAAALAAKTTEDAERESRNLLAVMKEKPRRHSMSDPAALQSYAATNPRPILLPRSPYSTDCGTGYPGSVPSPRCIPLCVAPSVRLFVNSVQSGGGGEVDRHRKSLSAERASEPAPPRRKRSARRPTDRPTERSLCQKLPGEDLVARWQV